MLASRWYLGYDASQPRVPGEAAQVPALDRRMSGRRGQSGYLTLLEDVQPVPYKSLEVGVPLDGVVVSDHSGPVLLGDRGPGQPLPHPGEMVRSCCTTSNLASLGHQTHNNNDILLVTTECKQRLTLSLGGPSGGHSAHPGDSETRHRT